MRRNVWGYADFLQAMTDPEHEDHADMKKWISGKFDPEKFSVDKVNRELGEHY
jgi:hypothetical protein